MQKRANKSEYSTKSEWGVLASRYSSDAGSTAETTKDSGDSRAAAPFAVTDSASPPSPYAAFSIHGAVMKQEHEDPSYEGKLSDLVHVRPDTDSQAGEESSQYSFPLLSSDAAGGILGTLRTESPVSENESQESGESLKDCNKDNTMVTPERQPRRGVRFADKVEMSTVKEYAEDAEAPFDEPNNSQQDSPTSVISATKEQQAKKARDNTAKGKVSPSNGGTIAGPKSILRSAKYTDGGTGAGNNLSLNDRGASEQKNRYAEAAVQATVTDAPPQTGRPTKQDALNSSKTSKSPPRDGSGFIDDAEVEVSPIIHSPTSSLDRKNLDDGFNHYISSSSSSGQRQDEQEKRAVTFGEIETSDDDDVDPAAANEHQHTHVAGSFDQIHEPILHDGIFYSDPPISFVCHFGLRWATV